MNNSVDWRASLASEGLKNDCMDPLCVSGDAGWTIKESLLDCSSRYSWSRTILLCFSNCWYCVDFVLWGGLKGFSPLCLVIFCDCLFCSVTRLRRIGTSSLPIVRFVRYLSEMCSEQDVWNAVRVLYLVPVTSYHVVTTFLRDITWRQGCLGIVLYVVYGICQRGNKFKKTFEWCTPAQICLHSILGVVLIYDVPVGPSKLKSNCCEWMSVSYDTYGVEQNDE